MIVAQLPRFKQSLDSEESDLVPFAEMAIEFTKIKTPKTLNLATFAKDSPVSPKY